MAVNCQSHIPQIEKWRFIGQKENKIVYLVLGINEMCN